MKKRDRALARGRAQGRGRDLWERFQDDDDDDQGEAGQ